MTGERSGIPAKGASSHGEDCQCVRCAGFRAGHRLSTRHGGYARVALSPRAAELDEQIRGLLPIFEPVDGPAVALLAFTLARIEAASAALAGPGGEGLARLEGDLRGWVGTARRLMGDLGMNPAARARLARDLGIGRDAALRGQAALERYLRERYTTDAETA